ncbi:NAD-dependent epimerase/dehydratase family protein [Hoeflea marina]|nr:NAD-dependent epimerase/dehydratase family protein [Hoeflea marina]
MKIIVTGATGYIGVRLTDLARQLGHEVICMTRHAHASDKAWIKFDLLDPAPLELPADTDAVIHLAITPHSRAADPDFEFEATRFLVEATQRAGARMVFVSSQTARQDAPTSYGRLKWQIEQLVGKSGGLSVRPGQVYGGAEKGLFGVLVHLVRTLPVVPAFLPAPKVRPVHVDDLAAVLLGCASVNYPSGTVLCVGSEEPVSMTRFLTTIATVRVRRLRPPIPVPVMAIRILSRMVGPSLRSRLGLVRLMSLIELPDMETTDDLRRTGITLRPLSSGMTVSGNDRRRRLAAEGRALLSYVLKADPAPGLIRRYVRCVETTRSPRPMDLPGIFLRYPAALALLDSPAIRKLDCAGEFAWRLDAAVLLAEATVAGSRRFLEINRPVGRTRSLFRLGHAVHMEAWWRLLALAGRPVVDQIIRKTWQS